MGQDFLSQDEVDALLRGVTGDVETSEEESGGEQGVRSYNIATQERIVRGRMPTMELVNERFARNLRIGLFNYMHRNTEVSVGPIKVQKYSEFVRNLVVPTNLNLITAKPLRGTGLIVMDPNLVFLIVDNMFGGDGRFHTRVEGRDFTATEQRIIQGFLGVVFNELQKAWAPVFNIEFEYVRSEMNPQFANIATPSEIVISTSYSMELGGITADMHICLPYSTLEPIRDLLHSPMQSDHLTQDKRWIGLMGKQVQGVALGLTVDFGKAVVSLRDVVQFKPGDIIPLEIDEYIVAHVDGVPAFEGTHGTINGRYAVRVERLVPPEDSEINLISMKFGGQDGNGSS
jgi:flagellar motor switch protein FliM